MASESFVRRTKFRAIGWNDRQDPRPPNPSNSEAHGGSSIILRDNGPFLRHNRPHSIDLLVFTQLGRLNMSEKTGADMISRRRILGVLGAGVAFGVGTPAAVLTASDAQAQAPGVDQRPGQPQDQPTSGTERRQERRTDGTEQRQDRRTDRTKRRMARRKARTERAMARQEGRKKRRMARRPGTVGKSAKGTGVKGTGTTGTGTPRTGTTGTGTPGTGTPGTGTPGQAPAR
jgi:hypothetical protein